MFSPCFFIFLNILINFALRKINFAVGIIDVFDNINLIKRNKTVSINRFQPVVVSSCEKGCMPASEDMPDFEDKSAAKLSEK